MYKKPLLVLLASLSFLACAAQTNGSSPTGSTPTSVKKYSLEDYFRDNQLLQTEVDLVFDKLTDEQRVGQMIVAAAGRLGKPDAEVAELVRKQWVGTILLLNGSTESFKNYKTLFDSLNRLQAGIPLLYSADAEPSLINRKISDSKPVLKTSQIQDAATSAQVARQISAELKDIGILYNYAPVVDLSLQNKAIGNRSYGSDPKQVQELAAAFIQASQQEGVVATAKHFPGHGLVKGDSHHKMVYIDGEMKEVPLYQDLIDSGVLSIMVGHIAVENNPRYNTHGLPATCSYNIVTGLLKEQMGFKGIVTTDAMNMGAVANLPNASLMAVKAGCDMILMPINEKELIFGVLREMEANPAFKEQVYASAKKLIRLKLCTGLIL
jgi:beta-N-acetylhexosaminidase